MKCSCGQAICVCSETGSALCPACHARIAAREVHDYYMPAIRALSEAGLHQQDLLKRCLAILPWCDLRREIMREVGVGATQQTQPIHRAIK